MQLFDTHCHIHEAQYELTGDDSVRAKWLRAGKPDPDDMILDAERAGVARMVCVGTSLPDSELAVQFVQDRPQCWASVGVHPHEAKDYTSNMQALQALSSLARAPKVVAVGECGLDYYYANSPKKDQVKMLRFQIELALAANLPVIFHVRGAFDDFWPIFDGYESLRGVIHSFSATEKELNDVLGRNLYIGLNGIMTFTKDDQQLAAAKAVPLGRLLLETDALFLTPLPHRGTICQPKHVRLTAEFLGRLRGDPLEEIARYSDSNARVLFGV